MTEGRSGFQTEMRAPVLAAMRTTLQLAEEMVLTGSSWIDADTETEPGDYPAGLPEQWLKQMIGMAEPNDGEPIKAERKMLGRLRRNLRRHFDRSAVIGDKSSIRELQEADEAPNGSLIFLGRRTRRISAV